MPRKQYLQHLSEALRGSPDKSIERVRRGDDDGSFIITYKPPAGSGTGGNIDITCLIPDVGDYPTEHQTFLYTSFQDVPAYITDALNSVEAHGLPLAQLVHNIASVLDKAVLQKCSSTGEARTELDDDTDLDNILRLYNDEDIDMLEEEEFDNPDLDGWSDGEATNPDEGDHEDSEMNDVLNRQNRPEILPELRRDLRGSKAAGFRVGVLGDIKGGVDCYVSLSVKISKLGLSDEAINAWKLNKNQYFILLLHYSDYYKTLVELVRHAYHSKQSIRFCVGTSKHYKPSLVEAISAFSTVQPSQSEGGFDEASKTASRGFKDIFISRPLNELLNTRLVDLVTQRIQYQLSWDGAERFLAEWQGKPPQKHDPQLQKYRTEERNPANLPAIVASDSLLKANYAKTASFLLIAMQFTLRHFFRCTEFCLVCHNKIESNFEALKPYVCSNPLCLYQYMSLGFGPSIEHEIIGQPTVVDLLISFCYASAKTGTLADFPDGMNLLVPCRGSVAREVDKSTFSATLYKLLTPHTLLCIDYGDKCPFNRGEWIRVRKKLDSYANTFYYRIEDTSGFPTLVLSAPVQKSTQIPNKSITKPDALESGKAQTSVEDQLQVEFTPFCVNFDSLDSSSKRLVICEMIDIIPPVYQMKRWLEEKTTVGAQASLRNWDRMPPAACGLLRWVIASNRSCIVPVDEVDEDGNKTEDVREQGVWGMDDYNQFRFAMGAPDKEQRFVKAVQEAQSRYSLQYPTLFAFHGSPLGNWHSIVREGLHFKKTSHGRAYGHGCYHSLSLTTSMYYCNPAGSPTGVDLIWKNSCLSFHDAICLNEIVNAPTEFVSTTPHLVVSKLDWIQTRYLFVKQKESVPSTTTPTTSNPKITDKSRKPPVPVPDAFLNQDPTMTPQNTKNVKLIIPATVASHISGRVERSSQSAPVPITPTPATSSSLLSRVRKPRNKKPGVKANPVMVDGDADSDASVETESGDRLILLSESEEAETKTVTKAAGNKLLSRAASIFVKGTSKKIVQPPLTDFVPGGLNMTDIPLIPPPSYASSGATKRLQSELKAILKVQESTPLHELGWYINPDSVTNVYQWVFEFHSFDAKLPLAQDMKSMGVNSIVLESRFGSSFPMSPPFVRVIKPRFLGFQQGGGGHVTLGGALCMELLTNNGWSAVSSLESVLLQVRMAMTSTEPRPARLVLGPVKSYDVGEAKEAYIRACRLHNWQVPADFSAI